MARPATKKKLLHEPQPDLASDPVSMPDVPVAAVFSFLKDMRGLLTWRQRDLSQTLNINDQDATKILAILKLQGYIGQANDNEFLTTASGEVVSGSKLPRFTRECVDGAVSE